jgi:FtsH-binding integral membrane protein
MVGGIFVGSIGVFFSLSLAALLTKRRVFLFLGSFLFTGLSVLLLVAFLTPFIPGNWSTRMAMYGGLLIFTLFVLYHTQIIVEMSEAGQRDFFIDSISLVSDFIAIFVRLITMIFPSK